LGGDPAIASDAIVAQLAATVKLDPSNAVAVRGLSIAAMTHLCLDGVLRLQAMTTRGLFEALDAWIESAPEAEFVQIVLDLADGLELLVLAPNERKGFRVKLQAVRTNFHLFTLLQAALIGDPDAGWLAGTPPDPRVVAVATGEQPHETLLVDHQRFHFYDWAALAPDATLRRDMNVLNATIWGEGSPWDIPKVGTQRVVLLGPPLLGGRSWDSNFFANIHDALRSHTRVLARLSPAEVDAALAEIVAQGRGLLA
jgi:hypothetical protein